jgi:hypothetical protein
MDTPLKERFHQIHKELLSEITSSPQNLHAFMQNPSDNCVVTRLDLPSKISNEPLNVSQDDITRYLCAVDKNMRRLTSAIALRTIDDAHVEKEFELMESTFLDMIRSAKVAYRKDLAFRVEMARKEEEERLRKEAEELERKRKEEEERKRIEDELNRKRLEEERIARERQEEQARIEELTRNAPEFALVMRQRQENMERKIDNHEALLTSIFKILDERLPRPPPPPQP